MDVDAPRPAKPWPATCDVYVDAAQVAARLGYQSVKTFHNARAPEGWLWRRGFPTPALPRRWRASQIERWEAWNADGLPLQPPANDRAPAPRQAAQQASADASLSPARQRLAEIEAQLQRARNAPTSKAAQG